MTNDLRTEPVLAAIDLMKREPEVPVPGRLPGRGHRHGGPASPYDAYPTAEGADPEHSASDVASILGLPETAVTPAVLAAVTRTLGELDRLRRQESHLRQRLAALEGQSSHHPLAPVLNRHGFIGLIDDLIAAHGLDGTLVLLQVEGLEQIRARAGLAAGDAALRQLCSALIANLRATDPLGLLDDGDVALVLMGTDPDRAAAKTTELITRLGETPFLWDGGRHAFAFGFGLHRIDGSEPAEAVLAAADLDRRHRRDK